MINFAYLRVTPRTGHCPVPTHFLFRPGSSLPLCPLCSLWLKIAEGVNKLPEGHLLLNLNLNLNLFLLRVLVSWWQIYILK